MARARPRGRRPAAETRADRTAVDIPVWPGALAAAVVALVYLTVASSGTFHFRPSLFPHHVLIADAWLHGQLNVRNEIIARRNQEFYRRYQAALQQEMAKRGEQLSEAQWQQFRSSITPPSAHDWTEVDGKYYGYWGPMVPALLLPYVAVAGLQASDMLVSCLVGAATVLLTFLMLRRAGVAGLVRVDTSLCVALALLLGLGTVHFYLAVTGQVWFLSQTVATFFLTLSIWLLLHGEAGAGWIVGAGAAFGASLLSRASLMATAPFFYLVIFALWRRRDARAWPQLIRQALAFSLPVIVAGLISLGYNHARFGDAFESGAGIQILTGGNPLFREDYLAHGLFSLHYLPRNLYYYFFNPLLRHDASTGAISFDPWGNSMFLVTPALLYVLRAYRSGDWFNLATWAGAGAALGLLLFYECTGWYQFGNRYLLDLMPLAILLIATGMRGRLTRVAVVLIVLSIVVNAWGTYRFCAVQF